METYSKGGCIQRHDVLEGKAYSAAREVILKAEKHPVVKAYLKALKFVEEQQNRAKAKHGPRSLPGILVTQKLCPHLLASQMSHTYRMLSKRFRKWRMKSFAMEKRMPHKQNKRKSRAILFICLL